jgi:hypothetical protein
MRGSRALSAVAVTGLSLLLLGPVISASAAPAPAAAARTVAAAAAPVRAARTPFPGKSAAAIQALAVKAMGRAASVHVTGRQTDGKAVIDMDLIIGKTAAHGVIRNSVSGALQIIRVKSSVWIEGDAKFWTAAGAPEPAKLAKVWVLMDGQDADSRQVRDLTTLAGWTRQVAKVKATSRVAGKAVRGHATVGLAVGKGVLYVAATGPAYPVLATGGAKSTDVLSLTDWNKKVTAKAPPVYITVGH